MDDLTVTQPMGLVLVRAALAGISADMKKTIEKMKNKINLSAQLPFTHTVKSSIDSLEIELLSI
ncbi:hypothetical protein N7466_010097 [Penicillium verhagenii]|uniref:uncharacterized protein n=1 Tax=Penicillium verhagenii TaxID=1562060 RepID=UPI0025456DF1|nr:uncharacterized protein N7466_010097 [Penicillium verhagenii]KAJ5919154.1 hypothetical protein N7466_010097 [Penicillium verhagenii]